MVEKVIVKCICSFYRLWSLVLVKSNWLVIVAQDIPVFMEFKGMKVLLTESKDFVISAQNSFSFCDFLTGREYQQCR